MATEQLLFPIMGMRGDDPKTYIPWAVIAPHERQAQSNHSQTLARLAERGGLSPCEAIAVLEDRDWRPMPDTAAYLQLGRIVASRIIVMVRPDTAYMPVPRCGSCALWLPRSEYVKEKAGECTATVGPWSDCNDYTIITAEGFGCVRWEEKKA